MNALFCSTCLLVCIQLTSATMPNPYFHLKDNSVHLQECSPFWFGIFINNFYKEIYHVYCFM